MEKLLIRHFKRDGGRVQSPAAVGGGLRFPGVTRRNGPTGRCQRTAGNRAGRRRASTSGGHCRSGR